MKYGVSVINFWQLGHPKTIQRIARLAEESTWDGLFLWDHAAVTWDPAGDAVSDPWILLAGAACVTERIMLGTNVTPVPRRRPHVLATQVATLDHLSNGRAVLGVGIGGNLDELERLGEETDAVTRGDMLDEALEVIDALWTGTAVHHRGRHYTVDGIVNRLRPVQRPRCPIWVGGDSGRARRRAARWDGWTTGVVTDERGTIGVSPEMLAARLEPVLALRTSDAPFDVVVDGYSDSVDLVAGYEAVGATWWIESINGYRGTVAQMTDRVAAGPPRCPGS